jgi:LysR family carnitine catabolism transcriptional activator
MEFSSRQLRAFHLVAQHGSFARAADALFITPSGLSVLIRELERQVGFRLFDRTTRRVALTVQGSSFLEVSRPSLQSLDAAVSRIERSAKDKSKQLLVGTTPWMAAHVLPAAIRQFRDIRPDLRIRLIDGNLGTISRRVETGKLDLGLGVFEDMAGLRTEPLFRFSLVLIRPEGVGAPSRATTKWSDLGGQTLIALSMNYPHQHIIHRHLKKVGVEVRKAQTVNLLDTQIGLVEAGEGAAIIPSFGLVACRGRMVVASELVNPTVHLDFRQITNPGTKLPTEAAEFCAFLKRHLAGWASDANRAGVKLR